MILKEFDTWYSGLRSYWTDKLENPPVSGTIWRVPVTSEEFDYPPASGSPPVSGSEGGLWFNQYAMRDEILLELARFNDSYQQYFTALKTGSIYSSFYANLITIFSFVSMRDGMKYVGSPGPFTLDQVPFGTCKDWFSWYDYELPSHESTDDWFSVTPASAASGSDYTYSGLGILQKVTSLINPAVSGITDRIAIDNGKINSLSSIIQANGNQKIIYQIYQDPPPIPIPPKKSPKDIVLYDYKVKEIATEMGWNILGITQ